MAPEDGLSGLNMCIFFMPKSICQPSYFLVSFLIFLDISYEITITNFMYEDDMRYDFPQCSYP